VKSKAIASKQNSMGYLGQPTEVRKP